MKAIHDLIVQLQQTKGSNAKKALLEENKDMPNLTDYLKAVYEPTVSYYLTKVNVIHMLGQPVTAKEWIDFKVMLDQLSNRTISGFNAQNMVNMFASTSTKDIVSLLTWLIQRDIKAGVGASTINKVFPNLITMVPYRRCVLPKDSSIADWPWGQPDFHAYSQLKADGSYANLNITTRSVELTTRNGNVYPACSPLSDLKCFGSGLLVKALDFDPSKYALGIQVQGELVVYKDGVLLERQVGNGILNSIQQTGEDPGNNYKVQFIVWDLIPLVEAKTKGTGSGKYGETFMYLSRFLNAAKLSFGNTYSNAITLIETRIVSTYEEAMVHFIEKTTAGCEGTIIKHKDAVWIDGDDKLQVKGKIEFVVDLRIVGFNAGDADGKHANTFGSLLCQSEDGLLEVGVTGIPDEKRKEIHENRDQYLGKIVAVVSNNILYSNDLVKQKHSLFLPRILEYRNDKTVADSFQSIVDQLEAAKRGL